MTLRFQSYLKYQKRIQKRMNKIFKTSFLLGSICIFDEINDCEIIEKFKTEFLNELALLKLR